MADGDLYDEFGNYIGPELSESEEVRLSAADACAWQPGRKRLWLAAQLAELLHCRCLATGG